MAAAEIEDRGEALRVYDDQRKRAYIFEGTFAGIRGAHGLLLRDVEPASCVSRRGSTAAARDAAIFPRVIHILARTIFR